MRRMLEVEFFAELWNVRATALTLGASAQSVPGCRRGVRPKTGSCRVCALFHRTEAPARPEGRRLAQTTPRAWFIG